MGRKCVSHAGVPQRYALWHRPSVNRARRRDLLVVIRLDDNARNFFLGLFGSVCRSFGELLKGLSFFLLGEADQDHCAASENGHQTSTLGPVRKRGSAQRTISVQVGRVQAFA